MRAHLVKLIARRIVDVVERAGAPVSLAYIEQTVPDFASRDDTAWCWEGGDEDALLWDGMTAEGCAALREIVATGLVALSRGRALIYLA